MPTAGFTTVGDTAGRQAKPVGQRREPAPAPGSQIPKPAVDPFTGTGAARFEGNPILDPAFRLQGAGRPVFTSPKQIDEALRLMESDPDIPEQLRFTAEQADAAKKALEAGGKGVDPLGFSPGTAPREPGTGLRQPLATATPPASQPAPKTPTGPSAGLTGDDLKARASAKRDERLRQMGIEPTDEIRAALERGLRLEIDENGTAAFVDERGQRIPLGLNPTAAGQLQDQLGNLSDAQLEDDIRRESQQPTQPGPQTPGDQPGGAPTTQPGGSLPAPSIDQMVGNAALEAVLGSFPKEAAGMAAALRNLYSASGTAEGAQAGLFLSTMEGVQSSRQRAASVLSGLERTITETKDEMKGILGQVRSLQQESLLKQKEAEEQRLAWEAAKRERELRKKQTADIEGRINELGFKGGFGSGNGLKAIREADQEWEDAITEVQQVAGQQRLDLLAKFTTLWNQTEETYLLGMQEALNTYKSDLKGLALTALGMEESFESREQKALETLSTNVTDLRMERAKELLSGAKEARQIARDERTFQATEAERQRNDAWQMFNFAFGSSTDPGLRSKAVAAMSKAGYDLSGIDLSAPPLLIAQKAADADKANRYSPFRFTDTEDRQTMASALNVVSRLPVFSQGPALDYVSGLLERGQRDQAEKYLESVAIRQLSGTQQTAYSSRNTIIQSSEHLIADLKAIQDSSDGRALYQGLRQLDTSDFNIYAKGLQNLKNKFALDKKPELQRIFARLENIAGVIISERYGAAVTDGEMERAREYIAMSGNTLGDMIIKLEEFKKISEMENRNLLDSEMGRAVDYGPPPLPGEGSYDNDYYERRYGSGGGAMSPADGEMRTDRHNNPTAFTVDVARQAGLQEGTDYLPGDPFPGNSGARTALLLGDPVEQTIRVIDAIGFYTGRGKQRWSHTAMSRADWDALSRDEKVKVIRDMYQREGGRTLASLFPNV